MWALCELYDPGAQILYLYLVSEPAQPPVHPDLGASKILESFVDLQEAQRFLDGYLKALEPKGGRVVREIQCGRHRLGGCPGPQAPCYLGLGGIRCMTK